MENLQVVRSEHLPQEWKPSETGSLEKIIQGVKLKDAPVDELQAILRVIMLKLGLRAQNMPDELEKAVLISHIYENFGGHTPAEIKLAFDMALNNRLDVEVNCYENFSCAYFSSVMVAYRKWASEQVKQIKELPEPKPVVIITQEEKLRDIEELGRNKDIKLELIPPYIYTWMEELGLINLSAELKREYLKRAISIRKANLQADAESMRNADRIYFNRFLIMEKDNNWTVEEKNRLITLSKQIAVFESIKNLK